MKKLSSAEARSIIDELCLRVDVLESSAKTIGASPFTDFSTKEAWLRIDRANDVTLSRTQALLAAYVEIGGESFPMTGIPLTDGYLRPDAAVMRSLLLDGRVAAVDGSFRVTDIGRALIAHIRKIDPQAVAFRDGTEREPQVYGRGGEGVNHEKLRLYVFNNPSKFFPKLASPEVHTEFLLPSADRIDVLLETPAFRIGIEVKSRDSNDADLARGIYQCVKYRAVLEAISSPEVKVVVCLVTERTLPPQLNDEARRLKITCLTADPDRTV